MKTVYLIYTCNERHFLNSKEVIAVASSFESAMTLIESHAKNETPLSKDDFYNLRLISQTQGRDQNYIIDEAGVDFFL